MAWNLGFISEEDFKKHVRATIMKYGEKLESYDLKRFNSNLIDPIKLIFDKSVYRTSWEEIVNNEIFRQRDKSNNNDIGYFHQNIFSYFKGCEVPQAGWDVIYRNPDGIQMPDGDIVHMSFDYVIIDEAAKATTPRRLLDGEVKVLLDYLAENAQQVEMSVDNIDDWAYDKNFVGKLSHYVGKATLKIKYQSSNNIGKAIERIKQGHDVAEYKKHEHGYFICWKFDDIYEIYGLPSEQIAIDRDTTCIVVTIEDLLKHYLQKKFHILKHSLSIPAPCGHGNIEPHQF